MASSAPTDHQRYPGLPASDFLYSLDQTPWPAPNKPHYSALPPAIAPIPTAENEDWSSFIGKYYEGSILQFGVASTAAALATAIEHRSDYPELTDEDFTHLLCEGLYSKYLMPITDSVRKFFPEDVVDEDVYSYWKSDFTSMRVVRKLYPGEAAAASIVLMRRRKDDTEFNYEIVALMLQVWNPARNDFDYSDVFRPGDGEAWKVARYFVLQGAIHRINLIDHPAVHFPADTINALTKSVLPKTNLILRVLQPHMWLSLPVDDAVLNGARSIINPNTWYPWCPFVAKGSEVRNLLPFCWMGSEYYAKPQSPPAPYVDPYFADHTKAYPAFRFSPTPADIPSHYGEFLRRYFEPIRAFTGGVVDHLSDQEWREAGFWADAIAPHIPGHPTGADLIGADGNSRNKDLLADLLAHFIWNAAVVHSSDHESLHEMYESMHDVAGTLYRSAMPVPFILRVKPPLKRDYVREAVPVSESELHLVERMERWLEHLMHNTPLSWPMDNMSSHLADQLFYKPHNSLCLAEVGVAPLGGDGNRAYLGFDTPELSALVDRFHADLHALDAALRRNPKQHVVALDVMACSVQY
ncbi:hypothetical protein [Sandarakinorhabdus oryzae]|uniref:hypothetical protein n=1 Tax=Sandarakinorhabdus oryzae TaxID=2675220 RepID=UPI0012E186AA|nr:hypothetical protein [Sandarakinorhabdus oryzae]